MLPAPDWTVHVNDAVPVVLDVEVAVTVTEKVPGLAVIVPEMSPEELMDRPAGSPAAVYVRDRDAESVADICSETGAAVCDVWFPGFVTVTVSAGAAAGARPIVHAARTVSVAAVAVNVPPPIDVPAFPAAALLSANWAVMSEEPLKPTVAVRDVEPEGTAGVSPASEAPTQVKTAQSPFLPVVREGHVTVAVEAPPDTPWTTSTGVVVLHPE
jgi:hypothetical protein